MKAKIIRATTVASSLNTFCRGQLQELSQSYEVIGLSSPGKDLEEVAKREGIRIIAVRMERHISITRDVISLLKIIRIFRKERPRMVHSMTPKAGLLCMLAAKWTGVPVRVHTFTGLVFPTASGIKRQLLMLTDRITCICATHLIPEGEGVKNDLINNGITRKQMTVLGYGNVRGIDLDYYDRTPDVEEKKASLVDPDRFTFLFVGRIVRDKGINELMVAFRRLYEKYPFIRLFLVGAYEDSLDPISTEARETIKAYDAIQAVGRKVGTELLAYYAASDCFVFPSYREGFPNTVIEAGAFGLPCIVTDINGSREIIHDGYNGLVVPPHDSDALFSAMKRIIDNPKDRLSMASIAREHVATHYEQSFVRQCLYDFYKKIL